MLLLKPLGHLSNSTLSGWTDSNRRPEAWKASALPTELHPHCIQTLYCQRAKCILFCAPRWIRTTDLSLRRRMLYPAELLVQVFIVPPVGVEPTSPKTSEFETDAYASSARAACNKNANCQRPTGTHGQTRTGTLFKARDFKSPMSTVPSRGHDRGYYHPPLGLYRSADSLAATAHLHRHHLCEEGRVTLWAATVDVAGAALGSRLLIEQLCICLETPDATGSPGVDLAVEEPTAVAVTNDVCGVDLAQCALNLLTHVVVFPC